MSALDQQDSYLLEQVVDPNSAEYQRLMTLLLRQTGDDRTPAQKLNSKAEWRYTLPYRGDSEDELALKEHTPFQFAERGVYRNGVASLALSAADLVDLIALTSNRHRMTPSVCVSAEVASLKEIMASAGHVSTLLHYSTADDFMHTTLQTAPETIIFDHTTINAPIDELLNMAYRMGVQVVDGVFPYHVAAVRGWDTVSGLGKWSYTHSGKHVTIGPDDDCTRLLKYSREQYLKFIEPRLWTGNAKKYGYEIRKCHNGLATYRAVYLGGGDAPLPDEHMSFHLPLCSSDDMVLVSINRDLASGVFVSQSNNAQDLARAEKNYLIEVRRDLYTSCVEYLISKDKGADIVGDATRYISQHNYVDLMDGVRVVRCASLSYADALCVSMVCALTAFTLRYRLTNESIPDIQRHQTAAKLRMSAPLGAVGRLAWLFGTYVSDAFAAVNKRSLSAAKHMLYNTDYIPGVCYDVYMSNLYSPELQWFEPYNLAVEDTVYAKLDTDDAFVSFMGGNAKTAAPTVFQEKTAIAKLREVKPNPYVPNIVSDPKVVLQHVYDQAFPGNSVAQLQNVAELRRVKDININTEFFGKMEVNKDVNAPEKLHMDAPVRTSALPVSNTPLVDAILASAKRNFNPPDIQIQNDPWEYAKYLTDKFISWAFVPKFSETIGKSYERDKLTFNVEDYIEWLATRDGGYKAALLSECPDDMLELGLERYDTIIKRRVKPKLNVSAQHELSQPQVIVGLQKKDTALFTSVFRKVFERFDHALRPEIKSAGRLSDGQISAWLTEHAAEIRQFLAIELDSSKYDKSQGLLARMIEALVMQKLGLDPEVSKIFEDSYVGRVSSRSLGLMFISAYQMKSGAPQTMLGNLIYNMVSAMEAIGPENIQMMIAKGDDNVVWLKNSVDPENAVSRMSALFNLEAKLIAGNVLYFSSGYIIPVADGYYFVPDPIKVIEILGELGTSPMTIAERYVSFRDRVSSLTVDVGLVPVLQQAVRSRLKVPDLDVVAGVDALAAMASDFKLYQETVAS